MNCLKAISVKEATSLKGIIRVQGSKNTVLPIMAASLLAKGVCEIYNCPDISDVRVMCELLSCLHVETEFENNVLRIDTTKAAYEPLPYDLTSKLRSSVLLLGPMLVRWQKAEIGMPGGCAIGMRPIDIHLEGFMKMNVDVQLYRDVLSCTTFYLQGAEYHLRFPSVGATENLVMAAAGAKGRTILRGVAREPEIIELCNHLVRMGVVMEGIGTDTLIIKGTSSCVSASYHNVYDRIVAGTYILMAACVPSRIKLVGIVDIQYLVNVLDVASKLGVSVIHLENYLSISSVGMINGGVYETGIYPAFPTDLQPVLMAVLTKAMKDSEVIENVFENRFAIVEELERLGADIKVEGNKAYVQTGCVLQGHTVKAKDLRQGAALVVAGMLSKGYTTVVDISYIERGYEDIVRDLTNVGVQILYV